MKPRKLMALPLVALLFLGACGDDDNAADQTPTTADTTVDVIAVEQLEPVMRDLVAAYQDTQPETDAVLDLQAMQKIVDSIDAGAADVAVVPQQWIAPVDPKLDTAQLGRNLLVIAVPAGNPRAITNLDAFAASSGLRVGACSPESALGNLATGVLAGAGIQFDRAIAGFDCSQEAVDQVAAGQLDAALSFRAELNVPDGVDMIDLPSDHNLVIPILTVKMGSSPGTADFIAFLQSEAAQRVLTEHGLLP